MPPEPGSTDPAPRRRWRRRLRVPAAVALTLGALALLGWQISRADPMAVAARVAAASPLYVGLAVALTAGRFAAFALRLAAITRRLVPCRAWPFIPIVMASQVVSLLLPGLRVGAAWLRAHLAARRFGGGTALHLGPNVLDQLASGASWLLAALAVAPLLGSADDADPWPRLALAVAALLALTALLAWAAARHGGALVGWLETPRPGRRGRLLRASSQTLRGAGRLAKDPAAVAAGLAGSFAFIACTGLALHASLLSVGQAVPLGAVLLAVVIGGAAGTAAHTPGGLGVTEVAQVAFLVSQGVPGEAATSGVLVARAIHYAMVVIAGGAALAGDVASGRLRRLPDGAGGDGAA